MRGARRWRSAVIGLCSTMVLSVGWITVASPADAATGVLGSGQTLASGAALTSPNGEYVLHMWADGDAVEKEGATVLFDTDTTGSGNVLEMQADGDLAVVGKTGQVRWQSRTEDYQGAQLSLQSDGNLVVYDTAGSPEWATSWMQTVGGAQAYAKAIFVHYGWKVSRQYPYLNDIWGDIESGWRWNVCYGDAVYPNCDYADTAYGIPQADPGSKMASDNPDWATDGLTQVAWGLDYIKATYGDPQNAYAHEEHGCSTPPCGYVSAP